MIPARVLHQRLLERPAGRPRPPVAVPGARRAGDLVRLHPPLDPADAKPEGALVAGERGLRERRPRPPPGVRDRADDARRDDQLRGLRGQPDLRDLRLCLRGRDRADDRRVRALGLPRRRLLGEAGAELDRRHRDRGRLPRPGPDRHPAVRRRHRQHPDRGHLDLQHPARVQLGRDRDAQGPDPARRGRLLPLPVLALRQPAGSASPDSWWARRFYGERNPGKQAKAEAALPPRPAHRAVQGERSRRHRRLARGRLPGEDRAPRRAARRASGRR